MLKQIEAGDRQLLASLSDSLDESARRSGAWLACRPGCSQCCLGPFSITPLDAIRLRRGLSALERSDTARASRLRARAAAYLEAIKPLYPGDPATGELFDEDALPESMDDVPCPALDPDTGHCDLYSSRPVTCRSFGPATRTAEGAIAACDLCYAGASDEEISRCAVEIDPQGIEAGLLSTLESTGSRAATIVAFALS